AREIIVEAGRASTSLLQRRLSIGYGRAAKILDLLEEQGFVGAPNGSKPREVLVSKEQFALGVSGLTLHDKKSTSVPDSFLDGEEGDDGVLDFGEEENEEESEIKDEVEFDPEENIEKSEEVEETEELEVPDFLLDDDGPEDKIASEEEILDNIREQAEFGDTSEGEEFEPVKESEREDGEEEEKKLNTPPTYQLDDDDTFFAR
ncbi:MAG: DNA translocase FtsK, partial [Patescibacteria group bacterium]|nr:DNA translocase FtsK [Patescibacteria group bacterium]